jgi:hypothetical protein
MSESRISLDGAWEFLHLADDRVPGPATVRSIQVPGPWQAQFDDLRMRAGMAIYRREVDLPVGWLHDRIWLRFGAIFHNARVWVNGTPVGANEGGFLPFAFDVTEHLVEGRNEIKVRVESPTDDPTEFPDAPFAEIPFGKQSWYGPLSGIWQSVQLERRTADHVSRIRLVPDLATGRVKVRLFFSRPVSSSAELQIVVRDPSGSVAAEIDAKAQVRQEELALEVEVPGVAPWSPEAPNLYRLTVAMSRGGVDLGVAEETFGFRTIETRDGRLYLNGEPLYLRAALDQDYYPDTICTVPSVEFLEDQFRKARELGLNCLRCHIKAADPRYYEAADRIGLLIWTELPNGGVATERSRARKEALLKGIVDRDGNHPSIVIWTIINENWGVDLVHDADHRAWLKRTFEWLKSYDTTRLVVDNSPLAPSFHIQTDIADYHYYAAYPDHRDAWDGFVAGLAAREPFLYTQEGDAVATGEEPLMCSEFGNWGLPYPDDLKDAQGEEPWWFETGHDWGEGVMYAHGVENRFSDWSLDRVFGSLKSFVEAAQWQQFRALKYEIEAMRRRPELSGYVITEFTDCHWESNGLLDMRRNRRVFHEDFASINADTVIVPKWERLSYWAGETARIGISIAHGSGRSLESVTLEAELDGHMTVRNAGTIRGGVVDLGVLELPLPLETKARMARVALTLRGWDGTVVASNHLDLAIHPGRSSPTREGGLIWSSDESIRGHLAALGYSIAPAPAEAHLLVASEHDDSTRDYVRSGGRLLLLPTRDQALQPLFPHWQNVRVQTRDHTLWGGDWASSFAWLRRRGLFKSLPGGPLLDEPFDRVIPTHVISGCNLLDFQARVHAGMVVGWVHKAVALAVERGYGKGHVVVSTFRLFRDLPGADPTATALIDALISLSLAGAGQRTGQIETAETL